MAYNTQFLNWLHSLEYKTGLVNSYHQAVFSEKLRGILDEKDGYDTSHLTLNRRAYFAKFLEFNYLEEIEKERGGKVESLILRESVKDLLKLVRPDKDIRSDNFMKELRTFVTSLYSGKTEKLLPPNKLFHELSAEVKLWILYALMLYNSDASNDSRSFPRHHPRPIGRDSTGNLYFIVHDELLYVQYGTKLQEMTMTEEDKTRNSLERSLLAQPRWKLLAESEALIRRIAMLLESFEEVEIASRIMKEIEYQRKVKDEQKRRSVIEKEDAEEFQRGNASRKSRTQLKKPPSVDSQDDKYRHSDRSDSSRSDIQEEVHSTGILHGEEGVHSPGQKAKTMRCMYFPQCRRKDEDCHFIHPTSKCNNFGRPACPGIFCRFLHPMCPKDGSCTNIQCSFEHKVTVPSLRRIQYEKMNEGSQSGESNRDREENNRSTESGRGNAFSRTGADFGEKSNASYTPLYRSREPSPPKRKNETERTMISPVHNERPFSNKELRCHYFPRCSKPAERCFYAHPREQCASFSKCVRGRDCPFLHGPCQNDGGCRNEKCIFEHYQQIPPRASLNYQRHLQSKHVSSQ